MSIIDYRIENDFLIIVQPSKEEVKVKFKWPIAEVLRFDKMLVVRLRITPDACENENVFGVKPNGEIAWQVPKRKYMYEDSPFTGMGVKNDKVRITNWDGTVLILDPETGEVVGESYAK